MIILAENDKILQDDNVITNTFIKIGLEHLTSRIVENSRNSESIKKIKESQPAAKDSLFQGNKSRRTKTCN